MRAVDSAAEQQQTDGAPGAPSGLARVVALPWAKVRVLLGLTVGICVPYFGLQRIGVFPERAIPDTWLDRVVAFDPTWTPLYLSLCGLVPLSVVLANRPLQLGSFARGLAALCGVSFAGFVLLPALGPRPSVEVIAGLEGAYPWLVSVDGARNAFPSLHAALTVFCMSFALRVVGAPTGLRALGWCWAALIMFSTLATKQHFALDVGVGGAVGALAYIWSRPPDPTTPDSSSANRNDRDPSTAIGV